MTLTPKAQRKLEYKMRQLFGGMLPPSDYLKEVGTIYIEDRKKQQEFLIEQGFSKIGAFRNIYNLDKGEEIL